MQIDQNGFFIFDNYDEVEEAQSLIKYSQVDGKVDTTNYIWDGWHKIYGYKISGLDLLVWTTIFIPKLMYSVILWYQDNIGLPVE